MAGILTQIKEADAKRRGLIPSEPYVHQEYPKFVRQADGTKALFQTEAEHRAARPEDFEPAVDDKGEKGSKKK